MDIPTFRSAPEWIIEVRDPPPDTEGAHFVYSETNGELSLIGWTFNEIAAEKAVANAAQDWYNNLTPEQRANL